MSALRKILGVRVRYLTFVQYTLAHCLKQGPGNSDSALWIDSPSSESLIPHRVDRLRVEGFQRIRNNHISRSAPLSLEIIQQWREAF